MTNRRFQAARALFCTGALLALDHGTAFADTLTSQVQIEAKFVELSRNTARELGLDARLAQEFAKLPPDISSSPGTKLGLGPTPSANAIGTLLFPGDDKGVIKLSGLLTGPQAQILIDTVLMEKVGKVISAPVPRISGDDKAAIDVSSLIGYSDGGVLLEVAPRVSPDSKTIQLTLAPVVTNLRQPENSVEVPAGHTMVIGGFRYKDPAPNRSLIVILTPQTVDVLSHSGGGKGPEKVKVETIGTGETIGHVADLKIQNLTDQPLDMIIPALILESKSATTQDYVCPKEQSVTIASRQTETIPMTGVCINRDKAPVGQGVTGALVLNTVDPNIAQHSDCHIPAKAAGDLLRICNSIYAAVDKIQKDGALKDFPYKDKQQQEDILVQWCTWTNPEVCEIAKSPSATKEDLKKVVYKQAEEKAPMTSDTKKKIDKGIDTIFENIELTGAKAKDLEQPDQSENQASPPQTQ